MSATFPFAIVLAWAANASNPTESSGPSADPSDAKVEQPAQGPIDPPRAAAASDQAIDATLVARLLEVLATDEPNSRAAALARIDVGPDPRALLALRYIAIHDNNDEVATRAVEVIGTLTRPLGWEVLADLTRVSNRRRVWARAIGMLGAARAEPAGQFLCAVAAAPDLPAEVRELASDTLEQDYPALVAERGLPKVEGSRFLSTLTGASLGGFTLMSVGAFSKTSVGQGIGFLGGAITGGAGGFFLGKRLTTARSAYYLSAGWLGIYSGTLSAAVADSLPSKRLTLGLGVTGEALFLGGAFLAAEHLNLDSGDVVLIDLNALAATAMTLGAIGVSGQEDVDSRKVNGLLLASTLVGATATGVLGRGAHLDGGGRLLCVAAAAEGGWLGAFATELAHPGEGRNAAGVFLGAGMGLVAGEVTSQLWPMSVGEVNQAALVAAYGHMLGAGTAFLARGSKNQVIATQLALGATGLVAMSAFGQPLQYQGGDFVLIPVSTAAGVWHGVLIGEYLHDRGTFGQRRATGLMLATPAVFGLGAMALSQSVDWRPYDVGMGSIGALWGAWFATWGMMLGHGDRPEKFLVPLVGADIGLLVSGALISPLVDLDPNVIAGASLGGIALTGVSTLAATLATDKRDTLILTNLAATAVGLAAGGVITAALLEPHASSAGQPRAAAQLELPAFALVPAPAVGRDGNVDGMIVSLVM